MPKYWVKNYWSKAEDGEKKEREREQKYVITMDKLRMAHTSTHGACKPPGPKYIKKERAEVSVNNYGQLRFAKATSGGARKPPGPKA